MPGIQNKNQNKKAEALKLEKEEFELPIALEELDMYVIRDGESILDIVKIIDNEEEKVNESVKNNSG